MFAQYQGARCGSIESKRPPPSLYNNSLLSRPRVAAVCVMFRPLSVEQGPHQPGQPFKYTVAESCDRIKEEFSFLQAQYHR